MGADIGSVEEVLMALRPAFVLHPPVPADHPRIIAALAAWIPEDRARILLPESSLMLSPRTCVVADVVASGEPPTAAGLVIGFPSGTHPHVAYMHFVWVDPQYRRMGLGRSLYERAIEALRQEGCDLVEAVSQPDNAGAMAFHRALGFDRDGASARTDVPDSSGLAVFTRRI